jgi:hypothetical protein
MQQRKTVRSGANPAPRVRYAAHCLGLGSSLEGQNKEIAPGGAASFDKKSW